MRHGHWIFSNVASGACASEVRESRPVLGVISWTTSWNSIREKLLVVERIKKFSAFYEPQWSVPCFDVKCLNVKGVGTDSYWDVWPLSQCNTPQLLGNDCFLLQENFLKKETVLQRVKEERNIIQTITGRKVSWICHILRRNCLLKHAIEWRMEVTRRSGRRRKQLLDDLEGKKRILEIERRSTRSYCV
jgi:hypothetical protein